MIDNPIEFTFERLRILLSFILILICVFIVIEGENFLWVILPGALLFHVLFSKKGILIDVNKNQSKNYYSLFGYKKGEWKSIEKYKEIAVLQINRGEQRSGRAGQQFKVSESALEIYLLTQNHRDKLRIGIYKNHSYEEVIELASKIANKTNRKLVEYNPKKRN